MVNKRLTLILGVTICGLTCTNVNATETPTTPTKIVVIGENSSPNTKLCVQTAIKANAFWNRFRQSQEKKAKDADKERTQLELELKATSAKLENTSNELKDAAQSNEDLKQKVNSLTEDKNAVDTELKNAKDTISQNEKDINQLKADALVKDNALQKAKEDNKKLSTENQLATSKLDEQKKNIENLETKVAAAENDNNKLKFEKYLHVRMDKSASDAIKAEDTKKRQENGVPLEGNVDFTDPDQVIVSFMFSTANLSSLRQYESFPKLASFVSNSDETLMEEISSTESKYNALVDTVGVAANVDDTKFSSDQESSINEFLSAYSTLMTHVYDFAFDRMIKDKTVDNPVDQGKQKQEEDLVQDEYVGAIFG